MSQGINLLSFIMILYEKGNQWNGQTRQSTAREAKVTQSAKIIIMATIFWDCSGILLTDFNKSNTIVNAAYCASLPHKLRDAIQKRRRMLSCGVHVLHDNAPVHMAAIAKATVKECGFQENEHPSYSPDLVPSD
jgi:hypothetical protein